MACTDCYINIKVLRDIPGYKAGKTVKVQATNGIPALRFWRDRLRDARIDKCVEIVKTKKPTTKVTEGDK